MKKKKIKLKKNKLPIKFIALCVLVAATVGFIIQVQRKQQIDSQAGCTRCIGSKFTCKNNFLYQCKDQCLTLVEYCGYGDYGQEATCDAKSRKCVDNCPNGKKKCVVNSNGNSVYKQCLDDKWQTLDSCSYKEICTEKYGCHSGSRGANPSGSPTKGINPSGSPVVKYY